MYSYLVLRMSSFCVANLRNSLLLRAICALNLDILLHNLLSPDLIRGSLGSLKAAVHNLLRGPLVQSRDPVEKVVIREFI